MNNPARFQRILAAIGDVNSSEIDRERHAENVYWMIENGTCRDSWRRVLNEKSRTPGSSPQLAPGVPTTGV